MPFVTFAERYGMEKGLIRGAKQSIEVALKLRFPEAVSSLMARVALIEDADRLERLLQVAMTAPLAEIEAAIA